MVAGVQPGLQAGFVVRQVDVGDAHVGKAEFRAPGLDGAGEFVEVGEGWTFRRGHGNAYLDNSHSNRCSTYATTDRLTSRRIRDPGPGRRPGARAAPGLVIYLHGDLGAGKTALTRALLHAAGHQGTVKSPTYTLSEPYRIALDGEPVNLIHYDLYRMSSPEEFLDAGFREDFDGNNICVVEWPEKGEPVLPPPDVRCCSGQRPVGRAVELQALSDLGLLCLDRLHLSPDSLIPGSPGAAPS
jgi:tRNA threonylcarbamoyladenosine biosynthesis protein TsaE